MPDRRVTPGYPFSAVVGLADMRLALLLNAVSPAIGGVLVRGEKGTAKSTMVRALAALLPGVAVVVGCRFACDPTAPDAQCPDGPHEADNRPLSLADPLPGMRPARLVELPVGATEDRLVGALDLQRALTEGVKAYEPGLLAAAHRGLLYVDEVNLLADHLVDALLDAAAMGRAYVERDGVSVQHPARFLLVGTMNPEEGELRPQLLDRFGLAVTVAAPRDAAQRAEVVRRRLAYDADPAGFAAAWADADTALAEHIMAARRRLPEVILPDAELIRIATVCAAFDVDGLRADIVVARAAAALAAWRGRSVVTEADVRDACRLALPHRRRRDPFDAPGLNESDLDEAMAAAREAAPDHAVTDNSGPEGPSDGPASEGPSDGPSSEGPSDGPASEGPLDGPSSEGPSDGPEPDPDPPSGSGGSAEEAEDGEGGKHSRQDASGPAPQQRPAAASEPYRTRLLAVQGVGEGQRAGRRSPARSRTGRVVAARRPQARLTSLHATATLFAAAPHQVARGRLAHDGTGLLVRAEDLREAVHRGREANLLLFVVDASGSMAARQRMRAVKGAVLSLLRDAYQRRDKVGLVTFRGTDADLALPPTTSHEIAAVRLRELATGGRTPLYAGLRKAARVVAAEQRRDPHRRPLLIVVTDGRATHGPDPASMAPALSRVSTVIVDCESGPVRLGLARRLATALGAVHLRLDALSADGLRAAAGRGGPLSGTGFSGTGLSGTGFSGTGFSGTGFSGTGFSGTGFSGTGFSGTGRRAA